MLVQDMPVTVHFHQGTTQLPSHNRLKPIAGSGNQLIISNGKSETKMVDMYNIYEVLQSVRQELSLGLDDPVKYTNGVEKKSKVAKMSVCGSDGNSGYSTPDSETAPVCDRHCFGTHRLQQSDSDETIAEKNVQLAALFRQHLQGLFTVLHQMTDAADLLRKTYVESVGV